MSVSHSEEYSSRSMKVLTENVKARSRMLQRVKDVLKKRSETVQRKIGALRRSEPSERMESDRSRQAAPAYVLAKFGMDTIESEPHKF